MEVPVCFKNPDLFRYITSFQPGIAYKDWHSGDAAMRCGHMSLLLLKPDLSFSLKAMDGAAANGHLNAMQWLHSTLSWGISDDTFNQALEQGHRNCAEWIYNACLRDHLRRLEVDPADYAILHLDDNCEEDEDMVDMAFSTLQAAGRAMGKAKRWTQIMKSAITSAALHGDIQTIEWLLELGFVPDEEGIVGAAAKRGHLNVLQWIAQCNESVFQSHPKCTKKALSLAVEQGHLDMLQWLSQQSLAVDWYDGLAQTAALKGQLEILLHLHGQGAAINSKVLTEAIAGGSIPVIEWVLSMVTPEPTDNLFGALGRCSSPDAFQFVEERLFGLVDIFTEDIVLEKMRDFTAMNVCLGRDSNPETVALISRRVPVIKCPVNGLLFALMAHDLRESQRLYWDVRIGGHDPVRTLIQVASFLDRTPWAGNSRRPLDTMDLRDWRKQLSKWPCAAGRSDVEYFKWIASCLQGSPDYWKLYKSYATGWAFYNEDVQTLDWLHTLGYDDYGPEDIKRAAAYGLVRVLKVVLKHTVDQKERASTINHIKNGLVHLRDQDLGYMANWIEGQLSIRRIPWTRDPKQFADDDIVTFKRKKRRTE